MSVQTKGREAYQSSAASPTLLFFQQVNPETDDHSNLRKGTPQLMGRERVDSITGFKKYDKNMTSGSNLIDQQGFESPNMSPMLTGTAFNSLNFGGMTGYNNFNFQNTLLQQLGPQTRPPQVNAPLIP
jgi:hypothetical protein